MLVRADEAVRATAVALWGMRFGRLEAGLVVAAFVVAVTLSAANGRHWLDGAFLGVLLAALFLLLRLAWVSSARLVSVRRRERDVVALRPEEIAQRAVAAERARLSEDIDRSVRRSLHRVRTLARTGAQHPDPRLALIAIQEEARAAMQELRRQLGLIAPTTEDDGAATAAPVARPVGAGRPSREDYLLVVVLLLLVTVEQLILHAWATSVPDASGLGMWMMGSAMSLTVLGRRVAPVRSALAGAVILSLGVVLDTPVPDGLSYALTCGLLLWGVVVLRPRPATLLSAAALFTGAIGSRLAHDAENALINVIILSVVTACAFFVGAEQRAHTAAEARATAHEQRLQDAMRQAVTDDRRVLARELHDIASHAVSLVAVQAGAAEMLWDRDPDAARRGLGTIADTVEAALHQLSDRQWGTPGSVTWEDVLQVVQRLRDAGLDITLEVVAEPPRSLLPTVHRLVQESLTNVLRHAPAARAVVRIVSGPDETEVDIRNDGTTTTRTGKGFGLVGLEERVRATAGTLTAGPHPDGGFQVHATLPHPAGAPHTRTTEEIRP